MNTFDKTDSHKNELLAHPPIDGIVLMEIDDHQKTNHIYMTIEDMMDFFKWFKKCFSEKAEFEY